VITSCGVKKRSRLNRAPAAHLNTLSAWLLDQKSHIPWYKRERHGHIESVAQNGMDVAHGARRWAPSQSGRERALNVLLVIDILYLLVEQLTTSPPDYCFGAPPLLTALFALALVSAILTGCVVLLAIPVWWGRVWSVGRRIHFSLVALAALAFTWQLAYRNLLGFRT
jgi:hypothetical protein